MTDELPSRLASKRTTDQLDIDRRPNLAQQVIARRKYLEGHPLEFLEGESVSSTPCYSLFRQARAFSPVRGGASRRLLVLRSCSEATERGSSSPWCDAPRDRHARGRRRRARSAGGYSY